MEIVEDVWVPAICGRCYAGCGIKVRRVNGVAVNIEGMPESDMGARGGICGKGVAGLQVLYDPNRLNVPLRGQTLKRVCMSTQDGRKSHGKKPLMR